MNDEIAKYGASFPGIFNESNTLPRFVFALTGIYAELVRAFVGEKDDNYAFGEATCTDKPKMDGALVTIKINALHKVAEDRFAALNTAMISLVTKMGYAARLEGKQLVAEVRWEHAKKQHGESPLFTNLSWLYMHNQGIAEDFRLAALAFGKDAAKETDFLAAMEQAFPAPTGEKLKGAEKKAAGIGAVPVGFSGPWGC